MAVNGVGGAGQDLSVELLELLDSAGEGSNALRVDEVHRVEYKDDILLILVVLQAQMSDGVLEQYVKIIDQPGLGSILSVSSR